MLKHSVGIAIGLATLLGTSAIGQAPDQLAPLQGEWSATGDPNSFLFLVEGDRVRIIRHSQNRPEMNIVKILAEGLRVTEYKEDATSLSVKGTGAACYQSPDGVKINSSSVNCGFSFYRNKTYGAETLSGFGWLSGSRKYPKP